MEAATRFESYVEVLRHLREPLVIASRSGRILAANAAAADALGTSIEALENAPLAAHSPDPLGLAARLGVRSFLLRARDGHCFSCEASPLASDMLLVRLSAGPEAAPRVHAFLEAIYKLHRIAASVSDRQTLPELCRALLSQGMSPVGATSGGVFLVDEEGANLELKGSIGYDDESADRFRLVPLVAPLPLTDSVKQAVPILLGATADYVVRYPDLAKTHPIHGLSAAACVPLEVEGRVIGTLGLEFPLPWTFEDEDKEYLLAFADQCALALARAIRLRPDRGSRALAERAARRLERLQEFTRTLAQAITPAQVTEAVVDAGVAAASARAGGLWLLSKDGATVCLERGVGQSWPLAEDHAIVPLEGKARLPILDAIRSGTPVWLESSRQHEEKYPALKALPHGGESSLACIPLSVRGRCVGGLSLHYEGVHSFPADERAFLLVLSWHSAQAIEWSRLFAAEKAAREDAEASQRVSEFLADAGSLLSSSLDYTSTLAGVAAAAVPRFADWCIVELEEERLRGQPPVAAHVDPSKVPFVLELSRRFRALGEGDHGIPGVIRTGKSRLYSPLMFERLRDYPALFELYGGSELVASMVVPISARGRTLGAILLNSTNPARVYDERDLAMAEELGRRAGLAVDNARLYREATQAERLKDEFLATLGHELRNPLAPIVSAMDFMNLQGGDAFKRERAVISRHLEHVVRLVDDLLDVARITRDEFQLNKELCEVSQVIARAVEMVSARADKRARRFAIHVPETGLPVMADPEKLAQAFGNLLSNAVKYTDPSGHGHGQRGQRRRSGCHPRARLGNRDRAGDALPSIRFVRAGEGCDRRWSKRPGHRADRREAPRGAARRVGVGA